MTTQGSTRSTVTEPLDREVEELRAQVDHLHQRLLVHETAASFGTDLGRLERLAQHYLPKSVHPVALHLLRLAYLAGQCWRVERETPCIVVERPQSAKEPTS
jgi:hypothetical protein